MMPTSMYGVSRGLSAWTKTPTEDPCRHDRVDGCVSRYRRHPVVVRPAARVKHFGGFSNQRLSLIIRAWKGSRLTQHHAAKFRLHFIKSKFTEAAQSPSPRRAAPACHRL